MNDQRHEQEPVVCLYLKDCLQMTAAELQVYLVLSHYATLPNGAYPSIATISSLINTKKRAIIYSLDGLARKGFIVRKKRPGKSSFYELSRIPFREQSTVSSGAKNCTTQDKPVQNNAPHQCKKLHPNKIDVVNINHEQEQEHTRTRKEKKQLESIINFSITNPACDLKNPQEMTKNKILPFTNDGLHNIYLAGLKIGYRMTVAEVFKFALIMIYGKYYTKRGIAHKVRDYDKLLYDWKAKQTPEAARQAISEQERLKAGEKIKSGDLGYISNDWGEWIRSAPFPEQHE